MTKLPRDVSGSDCVRVLGRAGFYVDRQRGSHAFLLRDDPPGAVTVPMKRRLGPGLLRAIIRQARMSVEEFTALL